MLAFCVLTSPLSRLVFNIPRPLTPHPHGPVAVPPHQEFKSKFKKDLSLNLHALYHLHIASSMPSIYFFSATNTTIEINSLYEGINFYTSLTHVCFEELCQDPFCNTLEPIEQVLPDSKINKANIDEIVLVGGSTCISHLSNLFLCSNGRPSSHLHTFGPPCSM